MSVSRFPSAYSALRSNSRHLTIYEVEALTEAARDDAWMSKLSTEDIHGVMNKLGCMLSAHGRQRNNEEYVYCIVQLIATMVSCLYVSQCKCALQSSSCLVFIIELFDTNQLQNKLTERVVDVLLAAMTDDQIKEGAAEALLKKVVRMLKLWASSASETANPRLIKRIVFLARSVVSKSFTRQMMFFANGGLQPLKVCSLCNIITDHGEYVHLNVKCLEAQLCLSETRHHLNASADDDPSRSLFSCFTWLLDAVLANNKIICRGSHEIGITRTFLECLETIPNKELEGVISCLVHIIEADTCTLSPTDIIKINRVTEAMAFAVNSVGNHIRAFVAELYAKTANTQQSLQKAEREHMIFKASVPYNSTKSTMQQRNVFKNVSNSNKVKKRKQWVISKAEKIAFLLCVKEYGVNMVKIREVYPFHPNMEPQEMYGLWRAMWGLPAYHP